MDDPASDLTQPADILDVSVVRDDLISELYAVITT